MKIYVSVFISLFLAACAGEISGVEEVEKDSAMVDVDSLEDVEIPEIDSLIIEKELLDTLAFSKPVEKNLVSPHGVQIEILSRDPNGVSLKKGDVVRIKYQGKLPDGKIFDSSDMIGMPLPYYIGVNMSVKGWDDALPLLQSGDKVRMKVPSSMAYGKKGYGKLIPPNTDLLFEMEILNIVQPEISESGLKFYKTVEKGGALIKEGNTVTLHFYGWLEKTGKLFDASYRSGNPHEFILGNGRSLPCWDEALKKMRLGEKAIIVSPSALAYGEKGIPELVPPNSTLIYSLEVVGVK